MLEHERQHDRLFVTLCMLSIAPDRTSGRLHLAGHPQPILITADAVRELDAPVSLPPGIRHSTDWPAARWSSATSWSVLMYTDGLIEGKIGSGPERLGSDGLIKAIEKARAQAPGGPQPDRAESERIVDSVISQGTRAQRRRSRRRPGCPGVSCSSSGRS